MIFRFTDCDRKNPWLFRRKAREVKSLLEYHDVGDEKTFLDCTWQMEQIVFLFCSEFYLSFTIPGNPVSPIEL